MSFAARALPLGIPNARFWLDAAPDALIREGFINTMIVAIGATVIATGAGSMPGLRLACHTRRR